MSTLSEAVTWLDRCKEVTAFVVGDPIRDEYVFVESEGHTGHLVTFQQMRRKIYLGGMDIFVEHMRGYCGIVISVVWECSQAITKRRYVLADNHKVFSVVDKTELMPWAPFRVPPERLIVAADYGHGVIGNSEAEYLAALPNSLAITVQSNSLNRGYNPLTKWPRADYLVVNEDEIRLTYRDKLSDLKPLIESEHRRLKARTVVITRRDEGCILYDGQSWLEMPAMAVNPVDTMGAGDAFLAVTAPLVMLGASMETIGLIGSLAAAIECESVGNIPVKRAKLEKRLEEHFGGKYPHQEKDEKDKLVEIIKQVEIEARQLDEKMEAVRNRPKS